VDSSVVDEVLTPYKAFSDRDTLIDFNQWKVDGQRELPDSNQATFSALLRVVLLREIGEDKETTDTHAGVGNSPKRDPDEMATRMAGQAWAETAFSGNNQAVIINLCGSSPMSWDGPEVGGPPRTPTASGGGNAGAPSSNEAAPGPEPEPGPPPAPSASEPVVPPAPARFVETAPEPSSPPRAEPLRAHHPGVLFRLIALWLRQRARHRSRGADAGATPSPSPVLVMAVPSYGDGFDMAAADYPAAGNGRASGLPPEDQLRRVMERAVSRYFHG
jgi:hypothetical protein